MELDLGVASGGPNVKPIRVSLRREKAIYWGLAICMAIVGLGAASGLAARREAVATTLVIPRATFTPRTSYIEATFKRAGLGSALGLFGPEGSHQGWVSKSIVRRRLPIPNPTQRVNDPKLDQGQTRIVKAGVTGVREQMVLVASDRSGRASERVMREWVSAKPQPAVVAVGTRPPLRVLTTSRGSYSYRKVLTMEATAYEPGPVSCGEYADGYTAIGLKAVPGIVAVDPKVIPLRTRLYVEGYGPALAGDVGGAIKGNRIDLLFETVEECLRYGRRRVKVYILED